MGEPENQRDMPGVKQGNKQKFQYMTHTLPYSSVCNFAALEQNKEFRLPTFYLVDCSSPPKSISPNDKNIWTAKKKKKTSSRCPQS
jgi:hypothetical protein